MSTSMEQATPAAPLLSSVSPGVQRIRAASSTITSLHRWAFFFSIFLSAYAYGLDSQVRTTFQSYATASFEQHSLLATINVVRSIVAAAVQPAYAKVSDVFGRSTILIFSVLVYLVGTVVEATATGIPQFSGGALLYQFGYTGIVLLLEILVADTTTLRNRLLASFIPGAPFIINTWVGGNLVDSVIGTTTWQWGVGMWAIIFPVCTLPLFMCLMYADWKAYKQGLFEGIPSAWKSLTNRNQMTELFWQVDLPGLIFLAATLALILLPFTLAGGEQSTWETARTLAPLIVGVVVALPCFVLWELYMARHPLLPFVLLRERTVLAGLVIALMMNCSWALQGDYLYPVVLVAFGETELSAQRITAVYSFVSVLTGIGLGFVVRYVRRLKPFIIFGACMFITAFGVLIEFRGGEGDGSGNVSGMIGGQFLLGFAGGFISYPTQASVQAASKHENVAMITSLYLAVYQVGSAIGGTISGAIWTQIMYGRLEENVGATIAAEVYADPYSAAAQYPMDSTERIGINQAYQSVQRLLCITGVSLSTLVLMASLLLKNWYLTDTQSRPDAEGGTGTDEAKDAAESKERTGAPLARSAA